MILAALIRPRWPRMPNSSSVSEAENLSPAPSGDVQAADSAARIAPFGVGEGNVMASGEVAMLFEALPDQETPERLGGGAPRLRYAERGQIEWRPFSLDQLVPEDHRVRLVWAFVVGLDLTPLLVRIKAVKDTPVIPWRTRIS